MQKISLWVLMLFTAAHAQELKIIQKEISEIQSRYDQKLKNIKTKGNYAMGSYPMCSDVKKMYQAEKTEVFKALGQTLQLEGDFNELDVKVNLEKVNQRNVPLGQERILLEKHEMYFSSGNGVCFEQKTPVSVYRKKEAGLYNYLKESFGHERIVDIATADIRQHGIPYVLSSTVAIFPKEKRYQRDCWAEVNHYFTGEVDHGSKMTVVGIKNKGKKFTFETTLEHRFFVHVPDQECPEETKCDWISAGNLNPKTMKLYENCDGGICEIDFISGYEVKDLFMGLFKTSKTVYNLSTETHTYYVGPTESKVLVHNAY